MAGRGNGTDAWSEGVKFYWAKKTKYSPRTGPRFRFVAKGMGRPGLRSKRKTTGRVPRYLRGFR